MKKLARAALYAVVALAAILGALALRTALAERSFAARRPAPGKLVEAGGGVRLHAIERGSGPLPVLLIHGNPGTALDFSGVLAALEDEARLVAIDRPGHGWSERPKVVLAPTEQARLIRGAARALGLERPVVVGFSYGGPVALAYALEHPDAVRGLVLVASLGDPESPHIHDPIQGLLARPVLGPVLAFTIGPLAAPAKIETGLALAFKPSPMPAEALARARELWARPGPLLASAGDWPGWDASAAALAARYHEIDVPVEVLPGGSDPAVGRAHGEYLARHVPGASVVEVPGAGHMLPYTHPNSIAEAVRRAAERAARREAAATAR